MRLLTRYIKRMMDKIDSVSLEPCVDSKFVQPYRMRYKQVSRMWLVGARDIVNTYFLEWSAYDLGLCQTA